jgi:hypothetical protein
MEQHYQVDTVANAVGMTKTINDWWEKGWRVSQMIYGGHNMVYIVFERRSAPVGH